MDRHLPDHSDRRGAAVSRRRLIAGVGTGAAVLAAGVAGAPAAQADPQAPGTGDGVGRRSTPDSAPSTSSIASLPTSGWTYRTVSMYAFRPFNPASQPTWGGIGLYPAAVAGVLRAEFDIPPGALVREVEYYVYSSSVNSYLAEAWQYSPGGGFITSIGAAAVVQPRSGTVAYRVVVPSSGSGPYPLGSSLLVGVSSMPTDGSVQINGVRVGFSNAAGEVGLLDTPARAYDSRSGDGRVPGGTTRTVTLPSSMVAPGVTGVLVNVTAVNAAGAGFLKIYPASGALPAASTINFTAGQAIANAVVLGVSNGRQLRIFASATTDVILDISGTVS